MMLYNIAYTEDNAPDYDAMTHQVLIQVENDNEDIIPVLSLFEEVKEAKAKMDNPDEDDDPIYAEYEDEGWHESAKRYHDFLNSHGGKILYLELGVGYNTPAIIKYPFWQMTVNNPNSIYACLNYGEAACPQDISDRSICINGDIGEVLKEI